QVERRLRVGRVGHGRRNPRGGKGKPGYRQPCAKRQANTPNRHRPARRRGRMGIWTRKKNPPAVGTRGVAKAAVSSQIRLTRRQEIAMTARVEVYATQSCPYCIAARALLRGKGVEYELIDVGREPARRAEMTQRANGRRTVPQIFIDGVGV